MIAVAGAVTLVLLAMALAMNLARLLLGPEPTDRVLALDTLSVNAIAVVLTGGVVLGTGLYFEAALLIAMLGFVGTVAFCKFLTRGDVIE